MTKIINRQTVSTILVILMLGFYFVMLAQQQIVKTPTETLFNN